MNIVYVNTARFLLQKEGRVTMSIRVLLKTRCQVSLFELSGPCSRMKQCCLTDGTLFCLPLKAAATFVAVALNCLLKTELFCAFDRGDIKLERPFLSIRDEQAEAFYVARVHRRNC
jgi:hypothetical protein